VIPPSSLVILDTNVLVHLIRNKQVGQRIAAEYSLGGRPERPLISIVTLGELRSLARKFGWGREKVQRLETLARELVVVDLQQGDILHWYAEIDFFCEKQLKPARPMAQNDMWIAATAAATEAYLLTADGDFDHLVPGIIHRVKIRRDTGETEAVG